MERPARYGERCAPSKTSHLRFAADLQRSVGAPRNSAHQHGRVVAFEALNGAPVGIEYEALGSRTKRGIVAEADGRFRVYSNGASCGSFGTFDAALEELLRHLTSGGSR